MKIARDHLRGRRFAFGATVLVVLLATSGVLAARETAASRAAHAEGRAERGRWVSEARAYVEALPSLEAPPATLGGFCRGVSWVRGGAVIVPGWYGPVAAVRDRDGGGLVASEPHQDAAGVILIIGTLLAMFFAFDSIAGERERGTLRLLLSLSVPKGRLLAAHATAAVAGAGIPILIGVLAWLFAGRMHAIPLDGATLVHAGLLFVASLLLVSLAAWTAVLVSLKAPRATDALLAVALLWGIGVLVVPNVVATGARLLSPDAQVRPALDIETGRVPGESGVPPAGIVYSRVEGRQFLPNRFPDAYRAGSWSAEKHGPILAQHEVFRRLAVLSPSDAYREACAALSGTDLVSQAGWMATALRLQEGVRSWQEAKVSAAPHRSRIVTDRDRALDLAGMPDLSTAVPSGSIGRALPWLAVLLGWNILMIGATLRTRLTG